MLRHLLAAAPAVGMLATAACTPSEPHTAPQTFVIAQFDPTTSSIPLPNDLVLLQSPSSLCTPPATACAEADLIQSFINAHGFPSDQTVGVTIDFIETSFDSNGSATNSAPDLDLTSFTPTTFFVEGMNNAGTGEIAMAPLTASSYVKNTGYGEATLYPADLAPWPTGEYAVLIRGGADGIKTTDGLPVNPSQIFSLLEQNVDLTQPQNNGLLVAELGSQQLANLEGFQLDEVESLWSQFAFPSADTRFPHQELAVLTTFAIQPTVTNVTIDPTRGLVPLPIDLLRDPTTGDLSALAACTLAGSTLAADGTCPSPAAAGFEALDGFSTTGAILGPTSALIDATTINATDLQLWDLTDAANPVQVPAADLILEPCEFTSGCNQATELSPVIAIQPAGATAGDPTSVFRTKPLKDATDYAVVMTTGIKDKAGNPIGPGTVAKILQFPDPLYANSTSQLTGIDNTTAQSLEKMRLQLVPVFSTLAAAGTTSADIAIAYTFHTQTILSQGNKLAALTYDPTLNVSGNAVTGTFTASSVETPLAAFEKYGVDSTVVPLTGIGSVLEFDIDTLNALNPATGAFLADPTTAATEQIHVLMALPAANNAAVKTCAGASAGLAPLKCAPLVIFRHGLGGGRADMLTVANTFTNAGMVVVAIDAAKHGDRSFCSTGGTPGQCKGDTTTTTCTAIASMATEGDAETPGTCPNGFAYEPVSSSCLTNAACNWTGANGIPAVSGNYLISSNFFRTRDTLRQDMIDQADLTRVIAFVPPANYAGGNSLFDYMSTTLGYVVDPTTIYFIGQSLGSISGRR